VSPLCDDELPHEKFTALHHAFGFSTERRDNIKYEFRKLHSQPSFQALVLKSYFVHSRTPETLEARIEILFHQLLLD
jgi:hypothetical protein